MSETNTVEFKPIENYEHYIVMVNNNVYGVNRDTELTNWINQKVFFPIKFNGTDGTVQPKSFFVSGGNIYFSAVVADKEYFLKQSGETISEIPELPPEPEVKRNEFSGPVGDFEVEYKDAPNDTWKHVKNSKGHFLNHQSSNFAYPVSDKMLLYVRDNKTLYVVYTMPNGKPAKNSLLTVQAEVTIW